MKFKTLSLLLFVSLGAWAADEECKDGVSTADKIVKAVQSQKCPNGEKLQNICMLIANQMKDNNPIGDNEFMYQRRFMEASCVNGNDSQETKVKKIRDTWAKFEDKLTCTSVQFDVIEGSLLKYAVSYKFEEFLDEAISWSVNLNKIDKSDGRTVLDYVKFHIEKNKGKALESRYQEYYYMLKKAGAKHKSEL